MDFQPLINPSLEPGAAMPFFMAYPNYPCIGRRAPRDPAREDFEYLRRTYPAMVGKWQRRVEEILDKMDYEGSMIYDEFPDRVSLQSLGEAVGKILAAMEEGPGERGNAGNGDTAGNDLENMYLNGLAQVLVCNEIYRRRQKRKQETDGRITKGFGYGAE